MTQKISLHIKGISEVVGANDIGIIMVVDQEEKRLISIVCDEMMKQQIELRLNPKPILNTMLPEVLYNVLKNQFGGNFEIVINDVQDGIYRAILVNKDTYQPLSMRASDAILLHLVSRIPLYATQTLMQRQSVPFDATKRGVALPYNSLSTDMLELALKKAVESEEYEVASQLRDELKRRGV